MQELSFYLTDQRHPLPYFQEYHRRRKYISWEEKKELISRFYWGYPECLSLCIIHSFYENEDERDYLVQKIFETKSGASALLPLFKENLFTPKERKTALEIIKNSEYLIQEWFLRDYYNATEEEKAYIRAKTPEMRNHWDCFMYLNYNHGVEPTMREQAFQSVLNRGILYDLQKMYTAPHVYNQAWVPNEEQKEVIEKRMAELRKGSKIYKAVVVQRDKEIMKQYRDSIGDNDPLYESLYCVKLISNGKILCYPTSWTPNNTYEGRSLNIRVKDGRIIEIINT